MNTYEAKKKEYTRILLFWCVAILACFATWMATAYVAWHFVERHW